MAMNGINIVSLILLAALIIFVVGAVIWGVMYMKDYNAKKAELIKNLTHEQKNMLQKTEMCSADDPKKPNAAIVRALITDMTEKGSKTKFIIIFYDRYYPNSDGYTVCDIVKMSTEEVKNRGRACGQKVGHQNLTYPGDFAHKHMNCRL